jgi:UDP-4-amino-4,6-dideoxy-N-acetyl-beta-L-altrosamine transaminase
MKSSTDEFIPYGRQTIEEDDIQAVLAVLRSPFLTTGPKVKEFEEAFASYVSSGYAVAFSSGTAALHGAMWAAGVGPTDEVLVPTLSFLATANAVKYVGAEPVFVDSLPGGFNIDPDDARKKITPKTKAIVPVHFAGEPVNLSAIHDLAERHHLRVIEDAAHALGAVHQGRMIGSISDLTVFSFHPVKQITTGEGGMVTTPDPDLAARLRRFRHHGINIDVTERDSRALWQYDMIDLGYNYRLTDIQCALGISQLKKVERFLRRRAQIVEVYDQALRNKIYWQLPPHARKGDRHAWHLYILRLNDLPSGRTRDDLFTRLRAQGIGAQVHYQPIHLHSYYRRLGWSPGACPRAEASFPRMLTLPIFPGMTETMVQRVTRALCLEAKTKAHQGGL